MRRKNIALGFSCVCAVLFMLGLSLTVRSEILRAVADLIAFVSIGFGWVILREKARSLLGLGWLFSGFLILVTGCVWSGLNVARFYLYDPAIIGRANYSTAYAIVCQAQRLLQWLGLGLVALFAIASLLLPFHRYFQSVPRSKAESHR
jgi:hypothetical protein